MNDVIDALAGGQGLVLAVLALGGVAAWRLWAWNADALEARRAQRRFCAALYAEIAYNSDDLASWLRGARTQMAGAPDATAARMGARAEARHTVIYDDGADLLPDLPKVAIYDVIAFYNELEKVRAQAALVVGGDLREPASRLSALDALWEMVETAEMLGRRAMRRFDQEGDMRPVFTPERARQPAHAVAPGGAFAAAQ